MFLSRPQFLTPIARASTRLKAITRHVQSQLYQPPLLPLTTRAMASSSIPKTMKGILIEKTGGTEVLQYKTDLPVPAPTEGEILVKNEYIGINYIDTYIPPLRIPQPISPRPTLLHLSSIQPLSLTLLLPSYFRTGLYPSPKPEILGREASGTVLSTGPGETCSLRAGDRVVWMGTSGYAEYTACPAAKALKIPAAIDSAKACAALLQGLTAVTLVEEAHKVLAGDTVLVHAAAGGVGLWLCQVLRAKGACVIGTASSEEKRAEARRNGARVCCGYAKEEVLEVVRRETGGEGVRAVFDGVGKSTWETSLEAVARKGSVISFGNASGAVEPFAIS